MSGSFVKVGGVYYEVELDAAAAVKQAESLGFHIQQAGDEAERSFGTRTQAGLDAVHSRLGRLTGELRAGLGAVGALSNKFADFGPEGSVVRSVGQAGAQLGRLFSKLADDPLIQVAIAGAGTKAAAVYATAVTGASYLKDGLVIMWQDAAAAGSVRGGIGAAASAAGILFSGAFTAAATFGIVAGITSAVTPGGPLWQQTTDLSSWISQSFGGPKEITAAQAAGMKVSNSYIAAIADTTGRAFGEHSPLINDLADTSRQAGILAGTGFAKGMGDGLYHGYNDLADMSVQDGVLAGTGWGHAFVSSADKTVQQDLKHALARWRALVIAANRDQGGAFDWSGYVAAASQSAGTPFNTPRGAR